MEDTRRIVPIIDVELKKKIEKADIVSKDKKEGIKKSRVSLFNLYIKKFGICKAINVRSMAKGKHEQRY